jgi:hypothetical protein
MRLLTTATLAFLIVPAAASAGPGPEGPCQQEVQALCAGVQPGGGRIRDCMKEHRVQLSVACKVAIADRMLEHAGQRRGEAPGMGANAMARDTQHFGGAAIKPVPGGN